jgi:hypothetical protein
MPTPSIGSPQPTQPLPGSPPAEPHPALQRSTGLPASLSGLRSRLDSLRTAGADGPAGAVPLAPRKQAWEALGKHTLGALTHGAASVLHSFSRAASKQIASHSGSESALAHAYGIAAQRTLPLARNERATAGAHLRAAGSAVKDLLRGTRTYDASAVALSLTRLKLNDGIEQNLRKLGLEANPQAPAGEAATPPAHESPAIGKDALMTHTAKPHAAAVRAAAAAVGHAVAGAYHKAMEGTHLVGAKAQVRAPLITQAHRMARVSHSARAAVSFADASVLAKHARHYATISLRAQTSRAAGAFTKQSERFSPAALARGLAGISGQGKAALSHAVQRLQPRLVQLAHQMLGPHTVPAHKPTPTASAAAPRPVVPEGEKP